MWKRQRKKETKAKSAEQSAVTLFWKPILGSLSDIMRLRHMSADNPNQTRILRITPVSGVQIQASITPPRPSVPIHACVCQKAGASVVVHVISFPHSHRSSWGFWGGGGGERFSPGENRRTFLNTWPRWAVNVAFWTNSNCRQRRSHPPPKSSLRCRKTVRFFWCVFLPPPPFFVSVKNRRTLPNVFPKSEDIPPTLPDASR